MTIKKTVTVLVAVIVCGLPAQAASTAERILESFGRETGLFVVVGAGDRYGPRVAAELGENGNSLVHVIASDAGELAAFNKVIAEKKVKGCVSVEHLGLTTRPYRDYLVNVLVIMDAKKAEAAGLKMTEVYRCLAPYGRLVTCRRGKVKKIEEVPMHKEMDVWTHRYYDAGGVPHSMDRVFDLPLGFKWNAGLPMNFDNPVRGANRYSSTRAMAVADGRCFTFTTAVYENLGPSVRNPYGTDQYLNCRDAFNGRLLWRKKIGDTYYGGLIMENMAPMVSAGRHIYLAGENEKMLVVDTRTGETKRELSTEHIPGYIVVDNGVAVVATWKGGKKIGSVAQFDRHYMARGITEGTIEAYSDETGDLLWKHPLLGLTLAVTDGKVSAHLQGGKVVGMNLKDGRILWEKPGCSRINGAKDGVVAVQAGPQVLLAADTGVPLEGNAAAEGAQKFVHYKTHVCTPTFRVNDIMLSNRGGAIGKIGGQGQDFRGARAACLTGTVPAYGAGYIAQNWCNCMPGQIPGLMALAPIGTAPEPAQMQAAVEPVTQSEYDDSTDGIKAPALWISARGNPERSCGAACDVPAEVKIAWSTKVVDEKRDGTVSRDWLDYLNTRLTSAVMAGGIAIVGDIDHNEIIALSRDTGEVLWRFLTGGRMDSAPTLYKGICLAGDHAGYVYALKIKTGELIYRLRAAPEEKRMTSFGKVESVWPVIGGVMVADGAAYVSSGRTQGSDGGLLVRAFVPETGKQIWASAMPLTQGGRRNDMIVKVGNQGQIINIGFDLKTGQTATPDGNRLTAGMEGVYSWNWTRLGRRKFGQLSFGGHGGDTVCWNDKAKAACNSGNAVIITDKQPYSLPDSRQVTSLVMCHNMILLGGSIVKPEKDAGEIKGFVQAVSLADTTLAWDRTFDAKLAFNGLAVDGNGIVVSFDDGTVACLK